MYIIVELLLCEGWLWKCNLAGCPCFRMMMMRRPIKEWEQDDHCKRGERQGRQREEVGEEEEGEEEVGLWFHLLVGT